MAQLVKDLVLSLQPLGSLLWHGFIPWPGKAKKKKYLQSGPLQENVSDTCLRTLSQIFLPKRAEMTGSLGKPGGLAFSN